MWANFGHIGYVKMYASGECMLRAVDINFPKSPEKMTQAVDVNHNERTAYSAWLFSCIHLRGARRYCSVGGVVFYANYLKFFERTRTELLRKHNINQQELLETTGLVFVVRRVHVEYRSSTRLDDVLGITDRPRLGGRAVMSSKRLTRG